MFIGFVRFTCSIELVSDYELCAMQANSFVYSAIIHITIRLVSFWIFTFPLGYILTDVVQRLVTFFCESFITWSHFIACIRNDTYKFRILIESIGVFFLVNLFWFSIRIGSLTFIHWKYFFPVLLFLLLSAHRPRIFRSAYDSLHLQLNTLTERNTSQNLYVLKRVRLKTFNTIQLYVNKNLL